MLWSHKIPCNISCLSFFFFFFWRGNKISYRLFIWRIIVEWKYHLFMVTCFRTEIKLLSSVMLLHRSWVFNEILLSVESPCWFCKCVVLRPYQIISTIHSKMYGGTKKKKESLGQLKRSEFAIWVRDVVIRYLQRAYRL